MGSTPIRGSKDEKPNDDNEPRSKHPAYKRIIDDSNEELSKHFPGIKISHHNSRTRDLRHDLPPSLMQQVSKNQKSGIRSRMIYFFGPEIAFQAQLLAVFPSRIHLSPGLAVVLAGLALHLAVFIVKAIYIVPAGVPRYSWRIT